MRSKARSAPTNALKRLSESIPTETASSREGGADESRQIAERFDNYRKGPRSQGLKRLRGLPHLDRAQLILFASDEYDGYATHAAGPAFTCVVVLTIAF